MVYMHENVIHQLYHGSAHVRAIMHSLTLVYYRIVHAHDDDDEFRFNDASTHEGHLRQNGELTWFCNETIIMISHTCARTMV